MNKIELCMMTKSNRPADIEEWVKWHLACGFDRITIYDNNSLFSVKDSLKAYDKVEVREIKGEHGCQDDFKNFYSLYDNFCIERKGKTEWVCFIDDDEFVYVQDGKSIKEMLVDHLNTICMYWKMISFPIVMEDRHATLIDSFNYYSPLASEWNMNVLFKSMVNLERGETITWDNPHLPTVNGEKKGHTLEGKACEWWLWSRFIPDFYEHNAIVVYHYYHQSWKDWEWKCNRGGINKEGTTYRSLDKELFANDINAYTTLDTKMIDRKKQWKI